MVKKSVQYWLRLVMIVVVAIVVVTVLPVMLPFIISLVFALILLPVVNRTQVYAQTKLGWRRFPRALAIVPAYLLVILVTVLVVNFIVLPFIVEFTKLLNNFPHLMASLGSTWQAITDTQYLNLPPQVDSLVSSTLQRASNYALLLAQKGIFAVFSLATTLLELLLVPILTFYLLKDGHYLKWKVLHLFPAPTDMYLADVVTQIHHTMGSYLRGLLLLATNMFCIISIVAYIYDLPYPLVLALLAGIAEWIPIIGPIICGVPAIILAVSISGSLAVKVFLTYAIIQFIDGQIIMPKIMGHVIKLHPLVIITVIFVGGYFYGIVGMMTAVPITAMLQIVLAKLWYFNSYYKQKDGTL